MEEYRDAAEEQCVDNALARHVVAAGLQAEGRLPIRERNVNGSEARGLVDAACVARLLVEAYRGVVTKASPLKRLTELARRLGELSVAIPSRQARRGKGADDESWSCVL